MQAIYDKNSRLVGWADAQDHMLFDTNMNWIGFIDNAYVFSRYSNWLGAYYNGSFVDRNGRPVAWIAGNQAQGTGRLLQYLQYDRFEV